ncbi:unnamed protein product [Thelazia callipaeda]|uniref:Secreted protein n=1 Tax=Thelazia callipaeda TaxID=103827 RepID=A0A0N5CM18_THECL|nr:unnamed protein product [Thelazia callipaeda]
MRRLLIGGQRQKEKCRAVVSYETMWQWSLIMIRSLCNRPVRYSACRTYECTQSEAVELRMHCGRPHAKVVFLHPLRVRCCTDASVDVRCSFSLALSRRSSQQRTGNRMGWHWQMRYTADVKIRSYGSSASVRLWLGRQAIVWNVTTPLTFQHWQRFFKRNFVKKTEKRRHYS